MRYTTEQVQAAANEAAMQLTNSNVVRADVWTAQVCGEDTFATFLAGCVESDEYRPSIRTTPVNPRSSTQRAHAKSGVKLADAYDLAMGILGDERRAYRGA